MKDRKLTMNIGIISFMIVFVILCLVTFAILSLVSANSNMTMSERRVQHTLEVHALSSKGEKMLEKIDQALFDMYEKASSPNDYYAQLDTLSGEWHIEEHMIIFDIVDNDLQLHAELEVIYPGDALYHVVNWEITPATEWNPDQGLDIY